MTYSEKLKDPRWQKKRLEILERDKWSCKKCGDFETTLHVHHLEYNGDPWEVENRHLVTLCEHCHELIESINEGETQFKDIKIVKFNRWDDGSRIMFMSESGKASMRIYDKNNNFETGYNFGFGDQFDLIKICKDAIKFTKSNAKNNSING